MRILFVCLGNICRSPAAEGLFRAAVEREGFTDIVDVDSAGTHDYHIGGAPDRRRLSHRHLLPPRDWSVSHRVSPPATPSRAA